MSVLMSWSGNCSLRVWVLCVARLFSLFWELVAKQFSLLIAASSCSTTLQGGVRFGGHWGVNRWEIVWLLAICGEWGFFWVSNGWGSQPQPMHNQRRTTSEVEYFIEQWLLLLIMVPFRSFSQSTYSPCWKELSLTQESLFPLSEVVISYSGNRYLLFRESSFPNLGIIIPYSGNW